MNAWFVLVNSTACAIGWVKLKKNFFFKIINKKNLNFYYEIRACFIFDHLLYNLYLLTKQERTKKFLIQKNEREKKVRIMHGRFCVYFCILWLFEQYFWVFVCTISLHTVLSLFSAWWGSTTVSRCVRVGPQFRTRWLPPYFPFACAKHEKLEKKVVAIFYKKNFFFLHASMPSTYNSTTVQLIYTLKNFKNFFKIFF